MAFDMPHLQSVLGIAFLITMAWLFSENKRAFPFRIVIVGLALQAGIALLLLKVEVARDALFGLKSPVGSVFRGLLEGWQVRRGEWVRVPRASGGVGVAATQMARSAGLIVVGTAGTTEGETMVREQGAHHVLNHRESDYLERALALTDRRGFGVILEMLANVNLAKDLPLLAKFGRVIVIGSRGKIEITPRDLMGRDADIRAMMLFNASPEELIEIHAALAAGLENQTLRPVVGREFPLSEAAKAHAAVMAPGALGKIVLRA